MVGRGVITPIFAKEPIIESRLAPKGAGGGLAAMIPPGMRAVPVRVNEVVGVAGFVVPGMRVDVLISGNRPNGDATLGTLTKTLLQNIEVLSAGTDFKKDAEGKPVQVQVVNLLVTPEQAETAQPGQPPDADPAGAAQSAGPRNYEDAGNGPAAVQRRQAEARSGCGAQPKPRAPRVAAAGVGRPPQPAPWPPRRRRKRRS